MNYEVKISDDESFVWQLPHENMTMALANEMSQKATQLASTKNITKYLSDVRGIRNIDSPLKNFDFVHIDLRRVGYRDSDKIAVVHDPNDDSHDFIEFVSTNAGYAIKPFTEVQKAIDWLSN